MRLRVEPGLLPERHELNRRGSHGDNDFDDNGDGDITAELDRSQVREAEP